MAYHYAKKYGVYLASDTEEEKHHGGYGYGHKKDCGDLSCDTDDYTDQDISSDNTHNRYDFTSVGVGTSAGSRRGRPDSCDSSDIGCP